MGASVFALCQASCTHITNGVRQCMVDFGLAGFLDKFEERFGKRATTALLALIALAIASVCINTFYGMAVRPVFMSLASLWQSTVPSFSNYWDLFKNLTILVLAVALAVSVLRNVVIAINLKIIGKEILAFAERMEVLASKGVENAEEAAAQAEKRLKVIEAAKASLKRV